MDNTTEKAKDRLVVLKRIEEFERCGVFNTDVEEDEVPKPLKPEDVDYLNKKLSSKFMTKLANFLGTAYFENLIKQNKFIIKQVTGLENVSAVSGGAIVTCNHFNLKDNYAVLKAMKPALKKHQNLYKVIKESNYTAFSGAVGIMMKHANTLPLSSSFETMKKFDRSVQTLLARGEKILIYPEQAMWWNYKKPRPLKSGAFKIAVKNNCPIIPCFITMKDSEIVDDDGFFVQEYYVHFLPAIYPDNSLSLAEDQKMMLNKNYELWVNVYEDFYHTKLSYLNNKK